MLKAHNIIIMKNESVFDPNDDLFLEAKVYSSQLLDFGNYYIFFCSKLACVISSRCHFFFIVLLVFFFFLHNRISSHCFALFHFLFYHC